MKHKFLLKSLAVENFKAIEKSGTVVLTPLTVFIGNNGCGKSSLIEALEVYQRILGHGLDNAFDQWHGLSYATNQKAFKKSGHEGFFRESRVLVQRELEF